MILTALVFLLTTHRTVLSDFITCFTDVDGLEETRCMFSEGFTTCFTSYDINGQVTARGCSTTDRICVGEHTVQSRHHNGFLSSHGCQEKERVGHLYRGRDCENNLVEETFQRVCYCRYHWCNKKDYYYGAASGGQSSPLLIFLAWVGYSLMF